MRHPPYHLRANKAVDRLTLIGALKRLSKLSELAEYTYYGFGGPYLEDFRLLYEFYPEIKMVSFESDPDTYLRQQFHLPCSPAKLRLNDTNFKSFLSLYDGAEEKSIFWLDYTDLEYGCFDDFMVLLGKVSPFSLIKVTLRCEPADYVAKDLEEEDNKKKDFQRKFEELLPRPSVYPPLQYTDFAALLQQMIRVASEKTLSSAMPFAFLPLSSFCYADGVGMFTMTGIVARRSETRGIRDAFRDWEFSNLTWRRPRKIDVPTLSTKERLHLQRRLPCNVDAGKLLYRSLGYLIDEDRRRTEDKLRQYADFHQYSPYFMKAIP